MMWILIWKKFFLNKFKYFLHSACLLSHRSATCCTWSVQFWTEKAAGRRVTIEAASANFGTNWKVARIGKGLQANCAAGRDEHGSVVVHWRALLLQLSARNGIGLLPTNFINGHEYMRAVHKHWIVLFIWRTARSRFFLLSARTSTRNQCRTKGWCMVQCVVYWSANWRFRLFATMLENLHKSRRWTRVSTKQFVSIFMSFLNSN